VTRLISTDCHRAVQFNFPHQRLEARPHIWEARSEVYAAVLLNVKQIRLLVFVACGPRELERKIDPRKASAPGYCLHLII